MKNFYSSQLTTTYLLLLSIAIIIIFTAHSFFKDPYTEITTNIATELIGAVIIFFLVEKVLTMNGMDLIERIDKLTKRIETASSFLKTREHGESPAIGGFLEKSDDVLLVGYSMIGFLRTFKDSLEIALKNEANIRIIIIDPNSDAAKLIDENSDTKEFRRDIETSLEHIKSIEKNSGGKVELRTINWIPSTTMIIIDPNKRKCFLKVGIYPPCYDSSLNDRVHFNLKPLEDEYWHKNYINQFNFMWKNSQVES